MAFERNASVSDSAVKYFSIRVLMMNDAVHRPTSFVGCNFTATHMDNHIEVAICTRQSPGPAIIKKRNDSVLDSPHNVSVRVYCSVT